MKRQMLTQKQHTSHITERESSNVTLQKKDRNTYDKLKEKFLRREVSPRFFFPNVNLTSVAINLVSCGQLNIDLINMSIGCMTDKDLRIKIDCDGDGVIQKI